MVNLYFNQNMRCKIVYFPINKRLAYVFGNWGKSNHLLKIVCSIPPFKRNDLININKISRELKPTLDWNISFTCLKNVLQMPFSYTLVHFKANLF